ncbi:DNA recombinase [Falsibacillus albus]|uniref:DNA recombinase n=1 Tax=Falsibacillus albus TaxID=2478915 RepID=A0A3L7JT42_9BACI|nr:DNA recombinase [Falsibacillus albus]
MNINEELISEALKDFDGLFQIADKKTRKLLLKTIIRKIELENDRKTIKSITFWFEEENTPPPTPSIFLVKFYQ